MKKYLIFSTILWASVPAFGQTVDPIVSDLQAAWNAKAYGDAQSLKAIEAILKQWNADKAALAAITKERDELKLALEKRLESEPK